MQTTAALCREIARQLASCQQMLVLAESCTAGLVAATLARVPGISAHLCGSAVTYRNATKQGWLQVPERLLQQPGPVSDIVARKMARGVLQRTDEATLALSVTGHLGPGAPPNLDGVIYIGFACRSRKRVVDSAVRHVLASEGRVPRQREAARRVLERAQEVLAALADGRRL
ncbi:MAG: CinA family protein [Pirellulaceae bacterium]